MASFNTEISAKRHFQGVEVEACEHCGVWTASAADHNSGDIVGPYVDDDDNQIYDRICRKCAEQEICPNCFQFMAELDGEITETYVCGMCGTFKKGH